MPMPVIVRLVVCPSCGATKFAAELAPHCERCEVFMTIVRIGEQSARGQRSKP